MEKTIFTQREAHRSREARPSAAHVQCPADSGTYTIEPSFIRYATPAADLRQVHVKVEDVRVEARNEVQRLLCILRFADNLDIVRQREQCLETLADERLVFDDTDPDYDAPVDKRMEMSMPKPCLHGSYGLVARAEKRPHSGGVNGHS